MPWSMLPTPKSYHPSWSGTVLRYRHPWVTDNNKIGISRNVSFAKLSPVERGRVEEQLAELLQAKPTSQREYANYLDPKLEESYFGPFREIEVKDITQGTRDEEGTPAILIRHGPKGLIVPKYNEEVLRLREKVKALEAKNRAQGDLLESTLLKHNQRCTATVGEAVDAFGPDYNPKDIPRRRQPVNRVHAFGQHVGTDTLLRNIDAAKVDEFIDRYDAAATQASVRANLAAFFRFCRRRMKLAVTPFQTDSLKKRRIPHQHIVAIKKYEDLRLVIDSYEDDPWVRSWVAFACLAGPRLSEQLKIETKYFNFRSDPPTVYIPATKTTDCAIPIERKILLGILKSFVAGLPKGQKFLWVGHTGKPAGKHYVYYRLYKARARLVLGKRKFAELEKKIREKMRGMDKSKWRNLQIKEYSAVKHENPVLNYGPKEFRHTFGTLLSLCGYSDDSISRMMRNSPGVVASHYNAIAPADKRIRGKLVWND